MIIKRVGVLSVAKIMGALYAMLGLIIGVMFGLIMMLGGFASMASNNEGAAFGAGMGMGMGLAMMIFMPIFYGVAGLVGGLITGALYNLTAGFMGGIEIDVE